MPVYYQGKVVGHKTRKSDTLLMFAIKNLQRRRERDIPKNRRHRIFGVSGSFGRHRFFAPDPEDEDAGAAEATVMEGLAEPGETAPVQDATAEPPEATTAPPRQRPGTQDSRTGAKDRKRRRGAWRGWPEWTSPLPVYARALWRRPLLA